MIKNDKAWIGDLLGGPLMSRESRVIAELLLTDPDEQTWQEQNCWPQHFTSLFS